jgi:hypothetical protein
VPDSNTVRVYSGRTMRLIELICTAREKFHHSHPDADWGSIRADEFLANYLAAATPTPAGCVVTGESYRTTELIGQLDVVMAYLEEDAPKTAYAIVKIIKARLASGEAEPCDIRTLEVCRRQLENILYCCDQEPPVLIESIRVYAEIALGRIRKESSPEA